MKPFIDPYRYDDEAVTDDNEQRQRDEEDDDEDDEDGQILRRFIYRCCRCSFIQYLSRI